MRAFLVALAGALVTSLAVAQPEMRGMWVSRFEWPHASPAVAQANIDAVMADLAAANFNAVFMQIRGQADVLYPSPHEVWSPLIGGSDPGWDPLAYAIDAAHAHGLEFHAYINTHTCWQSGSASPPANPNHLFYQHCDASNPASRDWLHHDNPTSPAQFSESDYVWIAPGVPAFQAYIRQQIMHVVANYDVDGVHWDRIRTPWANQPSFDPISVARFNDPQSNPDNLDLTGWTADQITRNVRDIYAAIMAVKPHVKVSAAVFSNPATAPTAQHQEALVWANTGGLDILVPMIYLGGGAGSTWDTRLQQWLGGASRHVVAGQITSVGCGTLLDQVELARLRGAEGNCVFSVSSFGCWNQYVAEVYPAPVATPALSWKDAPTHAIIYGYVTDGGGAPVVDAHVTRGGSSYVGLSTGDGFYSLLLVPPGAHTLSASHPAHDPLVIPNVSVSAGDVLRVDFALGDALPPVLNPVVPDPADAIVGEPYTQQLTLAQGSADTWTLLDGPSGADVNDSGLVSGWTPTLADLGQHFTFTVRAENAAGFDEETWQVHVLAAPPCDGVRLSGFEGVPDGTAVMFHLPRFSGSTSSHLENAPNVAETTSATAFGGSSALRVAWQFVDAAPQRWMRLTTFNGPLTPNPTISFDRPVRLRLRLDSGRLRVALGVRETGTDAQIGQDGGTNGTIEWIGASGDNGGAPQGVLVEGQPGVWQTLIFDPLSDPVHGMTGDGSLFSLTGQGVLEHVAFSAVDSTGPFTVYLDEIDVLCDPPDYGDLDGDGEVGPGDFDLLAPCMQGPDHAVGGACLDADADGDGDVDARDLAVFQTVFNPL